MRIKDNEDNENAVSPVIGVLLMVAITVVMGAIIAAYVFGNANMLPKTHIVGATAAQMSPSKITVTYIGGQDHDLLDSLNISINNVVVQTVTSPRIGYSYSSGMGTHDRDHVVVTGKFLDGSEQIILDTYV